MEKNILGTTERQSKSNTFFRHSQHGFRKEKSCLINFCPSMLRSPAQRIKERLHPECMLVFLDFDTVPHNIILDKFSKENVQAALGKGLGSKGCCECVWLLVLFLRAHF